MSHTHHHLLQQRRSSLPFVDYDPHETIYEESSPSLHSVHSPKPARASMPGKRHTYLHHVVSRASTPTTVYADDLQRTVFEPDLPPPAFEHNGSSIISIHSSHQTPGILGWADVVDVRDFYNMDVWRAACVEFVSMLLYTYISLSSSITAANLGLRVEVVAVLHIFFIALFIMATATATGAHFNPNITLTLLFCRMITLGRAVWYILAQACGAIVAGLLLRTASNAPALLDNVRCAYGSQVGLGAVFVNEIVGNWVFLFLTLYIALDARQQKVYGSIAGPLLCGVIVAVLIAGNASMQQGLSVSMNSGRCLGSHVAALDFGGLWMFWTGGAIAALLSAGVYHLVPPHHTLLYSHT